MCIKKWLMVSTVVATVLLVSAAVFADQVDINFTGSDSSSTWSWAGGSSTLSASADTASIGLVGGSSSPILGSGLVSFTSGPGTGGSGTLASPYMFGPSASGSIVVNGCVPGSSSGCSAVNLFTGQFEVGELGLTGGNTFDFTGSDVTGSLNPAVASFFGLSTNTVVGSLSAVLSCSSTNCTSGLSGLTGSGDLIVGPSGGGPPPPVPEPSVLLLFGSGLLGLGTYVRSKRAS